MEIGKNKYGRFDIAGIVDAIPNKKYKGIAGYSNFIGWILHKLGFAIALRDSQNKIFYLNKKSAVHWLNRHGNQIAENATNKEIRSIFRSVVGEHILGDKLFPREVAKHICHFLLPEDLAQLRVNKQLNAIAEDTLFSPDEIAYNLNHFIQKAKAIIVENDNKFPIEFETVRMYRTTRRSANLGKGTREFLNKIRRQAHAIEEKAVEPLEKFILGLIAHNRLIPAALDPLPAEQKRLIVESYEEIAKLCANKAWLPALKEVCDRLTAQLPPVI